MGFRFAVWMVAWGLRHGVTRDKAAEAIASSYAWRDPAWQAEVLNCAVARNWARNLG